MNLAVKNLIETLDGNPRANWSQVILMHLTAMRGLGHVEGHRAATGVAAIPSKPEVTGQETDKPEVKSHEELLEERGADVFMRILARRFGVFLQQYPDLDPESLTLVMESINNEATGESQGYLLKLFFKKDAKTQ